MSARPSVRGIGLAALLGALLLVTAAGAQPVVQLDVDAAMSRGATGAPVTIVEFSDYQ
jgi:protein-disulfide isomerase